MNNDSTEKEEMILFDSPEAARYSETIKGWISRSGQIYPSPEPTGNDAREAAERAMDERAARYAGCTHMRCGCGNIVEKHELCLPCREKHDIGRYYKMPACDWDAETPLYSDAYDLYFMDIDDLGDYLDEHPTPVSDLRLLICVPVFLRDLDPDYWEERIDFDSDVGFEVPERLSLAIEQLNSVIAELNAKSPAGWTPGKIRADTHSVERFLK